MSESRRPAGFRFYPTEEELICFYLHHQLQGNAGNTIHQVIPVLDIYDKDPSKLQSLAGEVCREDPEQWFFFVPRQEREAQGGRPSRSTGLGYWKGTGSPSHVYSSLNSGVIGVKRTMVFYQGRPPNGRKTKWKMNEYRAIVMGQSTTDGVGVGHNNNSVVPQLRNEFSLCRVYVVSGMKSRAFDRRPPEAEGGYVGPPLSGGGSREQGGSSRQGANLKDQRSMELISNPIVTPETTTSTQLDDSVWDSDWEFPDLDPLDRLIT